jgi:hypothetical protein
LINDTVSARHGLLPDHALALKSVEVYSSLRASGTLRLDGEEYPIGYALAQIAPACFGSKLHKWLAILVGIQVLLWMTTGALVSFLDLEEVRSEHVISRTPETLPSAAIPDWLRANKSIVSEVIADLEG